jgi:ferredoxin
MRIPLVDIGECSLCGGCIEICPAVFLMNDMGYIEVAELDAYPEREVEEAMKYCPEDCIYWEEENAP